ncbi:MAG: ribbon-helix-helix domain-containing protein [Candidatus Bathyarchaeia archaeon]
MGKIYVVLSDDTERRLRLTIVKRLGGKKGDLSVAIEEAVSDWLGKDWLKPGDHRT